MMEKNIPHSPECLENSIKDLQDLLSADTWANRTIFAIELLQFNITIVVSAMAMAEISGESQSESCWVEKGFG